MIGRTRWQTLLSVVLLSGSLTYLVARWWNGQGGQPWPVSPLVTVMLLAFAVVLYSLGRSVRRFVLGRRPPMDPLHAFRIFVLAKASALAGAVQLGFFTAQLLVVLEAPDSAGARAQAWADGAAAAACLILIGVALLVEWFCRVPPVEPEKNHPEGAAA